MSLERSKNNNYIDLYIEDMNKSLLTPKTGNYHERRADIFAMSFLIPTDSLIPKISELKKKGYTINDIDMIFLLARQFGVPCDVMQARLQMLFSYSLTEPLLIDPLVLKLNVIKWLHSFVIVKNNPEQSQVNYFNPDIRKHLENSLDLRDVFINSILIHDYQTIINILNLNQFT